METMSKGQEISFTVPYLTPPSVNHYKEPCIYRDRKSGAMRKGQRLTAEAKAYKDAVCLFARGETLIPPGASKYQLTKIRYEAEITIYLGRGARLDADNGNKVVLDSLQKAQVIHSDARVRACRSIIVDDERDNPRTHIKVWVVQQERRDEPTHDDENATDTERKPMKKAHATLSSEEELNRETAVHGAKNALRCMHRTRTP
jgi:Holliday junction resolvase RusA-like endonuclease